ncbi:amino acid ABC transporter permease [Glaciimonas sp. PCH181]|nr:amino acid ABC transporter permease [Glaciimonas sp. PCH181]PUA20656.1 amino acid ABC transporter permease [Glaciimonas sp. PCH181]
MLDIDFHVVFANWKYLFVDGLFFTFKLTGIGLVGGFCFGTLLALCRLSGNRYLAAVCGAYVNIVRSIPLILVIFWFYFLSPYFIGWLTGSSSPVRVGAYASSVITFIMFEACYFCEIMRAGINSVSRGQKVAGAALGLSSWQNMRHIIFPQAARNMLPVLLTQIIILFQDVSLVYVLSITDFVGAASKLAQRENRLIELYLFVAVVYFIICFSLSVMVRHVQRKKIF